MNKRPQDPTPIRSGVEKEEKMESDIDFGLDQLAGFDVNGVPGPGATKESAFKEVKRLASEVTVLKYVLDVIATQARADGEITSYCVKNHMEIAGVLPRRKHDE